MPRTWAYKIGYCLIISLIYYGFWLLLPPVQPVNAIMFDSETVDGNTLSTANPFRGVRRILSGSLVNTNTGVQLVNLPDSVVESLSILYFSTRHDGTIPEDAMIRGRISSSTELEFGRLTTSNEPITINWYVVEYLSGVNVQRGEIMQTSASTDISLTTPISNTNRAIAMYSKTPASGDAEFDDDDPVALSLPNNGTLRIEAQSANAGHRIWWQVVDYQETGLASVQHFSASLNSTEISQVVAVPNPVDRAQALMLISYNVSGAGTDLGSRMITASLASDGASVTVQRDVLGDTDAIPTINIQLIEFGDNTAASHHTSSFASTDTLNTESYSFSDETRILPLGYIMAGSGISSGSSPHSGSELGEMSATFLDIGGGEVEIERDPSASAADFGYQVISFIR